MTLRAVRTVPCALAIFLLSAAGLALKAAPVPHASDRWTLERAMASAREGACAAPLADGGVLIAGGSDSRGVLSSAEVYNADGSVSAAGSMSTPRSGHICATQWDGSVLVAGGTGTGGSAVASAELFNPATRRWTSVGAMSMPRSGATASLLIDGRILIAGGEAFGVATASVEIYDPASRSFQAASAQMSSPRRQHAAAVLADGRVLIAGGSNGSAVLNSADIFDPWLGTFSPAGKMSAPRQNLSATRMLDGRVLIAGGSDGSAELSSLEIFDPAKGAFQAAASMAAPRQGHLAFRLPNNNQILLVGGSSAGNAVAAADLYTPWTAKFKTVQPLSTPRAHASGAALPLKASVLIAGGNNGASANATAESFSFATITTDQSDYPPGSTVTITGSGWQAGETVQIVIHEVPTGEPDVTLSAVADASGNISNGQFQTDNNDVGVTFYVTATGLQSGSQAQTTFTDGNVALKAPTLSPQSPVSYGATVTVGTSASTYGTPLPPSPTCGTVTFVYGPNKSGSGGTTFASVQLNGSSTVTTTANTIPVGSWYIVALYDPSTCSSNPNGYTTGTSDFTPLDVLGSVSGITYTDNNLNMMDDAGDTPLGGVTVTLLNSSNVVIATTVSAADGSYSFTNLPAGNYTVSAPSTASGENLETASTLSASLGGGVNTVTGENFGYIAPNPKLSLVKTANPTTYSTVGAVITYTYTVTNSGNVTLPGPFSISDNKLGTINPCGSGPLAPGASTSCTATYTIVQADLDAGSITNIATASTTYAGKPVTSDQATATVTGTQTPAITLTKTPNPTTYSAVGQTITYTYTIANSGNVTLAGPFTVNDDHLGAIACGTASLTPGASTTCTATHAITQADLDAGSIINIATATSGNGTKSNQATATVTGTQSPALSLVKTANPTTYSAVGTVITYTYKITNSGNVTLTGPFSISDNKLGTVSPCGSGPLAPGASTTCTATHTITQPDLDAGSITNIATASTTYAGKTVSSDQATATVTGTQSPALSLVKTANPTTYSTVGTVITYTYKITNSGNVTLAGPFTVSDNKLGTISCGTASLAPGASTSCTATHTITQADLDAGSITNIATATSGNGTKSNQATATVTGTQLPALTLTKTPSPSTYSAVGQTITYTYTITNSGNVTLAGPFSISDNKLGTISPCGSGPLPPGASTSCTATYSITQIDLTAGSVTNVATASGNGVTSNQATATVTATVTLCSSKSSNAANFNGTAIGYNTGKNYIWFNSNFTVSGQGSTTAHVYFQNSTIQFTDAGTGKTYSLAAPDAAITFSPTATCASTSYDSVAQQWNTTVPTSGDDEIFLSGLAFPVPAVGISGGIKNVTWQGTFSTDRPGLSLSWKWGAAVYNNFTTNYAALGVKAAHNVACGVHNGDHAGTPENFAIATNVIGGGTGGGSSNFTGSWSGTQSVTPACLGGPITTVTQGGWGSAPHGGNPGALLAANFTNVYGIAGVTIGGGKTLTFTSASAIQAFLPQGGTPGVLTASATNPTQSSANVFGGQVLALELNVDFSNAGITSPGLGSLHVQSGPLQGDTVQQVLALANQVLGGGALPAGLTVSGLNDIVDNINQSFDNGSGTGYVK